MPYNGYSEEYLDRLENGNIQADNKSYNKRKFKPLVISQFPLVIRQSLLPPGPLSGFIYRRSSTCFCFGEIKFLREAKRPTKKSNRRRCAWSIEKRKKMRTKLFQLFENFSSGNAINENNSHCYFYYCFRSDISCGKSDTNIHGLEISQRVVGWKVIADGDKQRKENFTTLTVSGEKISSSASAKVNIVKFKSK